jgi:MinD superfamily P-loop ATPase
MNMLSQKRIPRIRVARCEGCEICASVCPHDCLSVVDGVCTVVRPEACTSEGVCAETCEHDAIAMRWMRIDGNPSTGRWREVKAGGTPRAIPAFLN